MSLSEKSGIEEERRLFYVAITRAKEQATLSYSLNRYRWGKLENCTPSRFLAEIDDDYLEYPNGTGRDDNYSSGRYIGPFGRGRKGIRDKKIEYGTPPGRNLKKVEQVTNYNSDNQKLAAEKDLKEGTVVYHERFGRGTIISIDGEAPNTTALVDFDNSGEKKLLLRFAKLKLNNS